MELNNSQIKDLYANRKLSIAMVADELGLGYKTVYNHLKKMNCVRNLSEAHRVANSEGRMEAGKRARAIGVRTYYEQYPVKYHWTEKLDSKIKALYNSGLGTKRIAERVHISAGSIYHRLKLLGIVMRNHSQALSGEISPNWRGGRFIDKRGYVRVWNEGHLTKGSKYIAEHILVWEKVNGKPLPKGYIIHHLNGIKSDNRPCNLAAMSSKRHSHILPAKAKRIRELEIEVAQLKKALEESQSIFYINEN